LKKRLKKPQKKKQSQHLRLLGEMTKILGPIIR
jgi:hypothetical protein